ncbi:uncharacterized protein LOC116042281 isoform X2 [Sander lucioperca]|uniref:uncharacterized protein LOC116042281 isoform X2 n=1 Tax=Sander lucioperca TaxID=283035 RepID=UPI001653A1F9|nr:uncharacterized protein LOC116042281 isoform X2 [Sander lucioperca]
MPRQVVQVQPESRVQEAGQWSTGLCECHKDVGDCCFALCCLPVFTCKVTSAVGACPCLPLLDCIGCVPPASLAMRASVRERYGIRISTHIKSQISAYNQSETDVRHANITCQGQVMSLMLDKERRLFLGQ